MKTTYSLVQNVVAVLFFALLFLLVQGCAPRPIIVANAAPPPHRMRVMPPPHPMVIMAPRPPMANPYMRPYHRPYRRGWNY